MGNAQDAPTTNYLAPMSIVWETLTWDCLSRWTKKPSSLSKCADQNQRNKEKDPNIHFCLLILLISFAYLQIRNMQKHMKANMNSSAFCCCFREHALKDLFLVSGLRVILKAQLHLGPSADPFNQDMLSLSVIGVWENLTGTWFLK